MLHRRLHGSRRESRPEEEHAESTGGEVHAKGSEHLGYLTAKSQSQTRSCASLTLQAVLREAAIVFPGTSHLDHPEPLSHLPGIFGLGWRGSVPLWWLKQYDEKSSKESVPRGEQR